MRIAQVHMDDLACPVCFGRLRLEPATVDCLGCGRRYPIVDELPVLIESRASLRADGGGESLPG